jgi:hypothetical protein
MKNLFLILVLISTCALGQDEALIREKMKVFSSWAGKWQGEGLMRMGPGEPKKSIVEENIQPKFDGLIYLVEGLGRATDHATKQETVVHHAFAVLSFDPRTNAYKFRTYLHDGRSSDAWFNVVAPGHYQWGFDIPQRGKTRYTILIDDVKKTWTETGEYSADGNTWNKFFEMNLKKTDI